MKHFIEAFNKYIEEKVVDYKIMNSSQNTVYLIKTCYNNYILKEFSHDAIKNEEDLKIRKEQIRISKIWNENGIDCSIPLTDIFWHHDNYYVIYPFNDGKVLNNDELTIEHIKILAKTQAKIHKMNINSFLPSHYKKLEIKEEKLAYIINTINSYAPLFKKNLCVCQNDYKPLNIIWRNNKPLLVDFDAVNNNYPAVSLLESAYTFSYKNHELDFTYYEEYLKAYIEEYKKVPANIEEAIYGCWNGKIQWLNYLIDKKDNNANHMTDQILNYQKDVNIIKEIIKKVSTFE